MLSLAALAALSGPRPSREEEIGVDPGIFSFARLLASVLPLTHARSKDRAAAALIEQNGGQITDDVERRIAAGFITAPF